MPTDFNTSNLNGIQTTFDQLRINRYGADAILTSDQINELKADAVKFLNSAGFTYDIADFTVNAFSEDDGQYLDLGLTSTGQQNYNDTNARNAEFRKEVSGYNDLSVEDASYGTVRDDSITITEETSVTGGEWKTTYIRPTTEKIETSESAFWADEKTDLQNDYNQAKADWLVANPGKRGFEFSRTDEGKLLKSEIAKADVELDRSYLRRETSYDNDGNPIKITEGFYDPTTNTFKQTSQAAYRSVDDINEQLNREAFDDNDETVSGASVTVPIEDLITSDSTTVEGVSSTGNPAVSTVINDDGNEVTTFADGSTQVIDTNGNIVSSTASTVEIDANTATQENNYDNAQNIQNPANQPTPNVSDLRGERNLDDWRVKLRLAPQSDYLYNAPDPGILAPLKPTDGVIFPYTPSITTSHVARYNPYDLAHSNYRGYFYAGSNQNEIVVNAKFTAQDTKEADYLLAVMHFLRSCTKMFYGQDAQRGTPPPLVFLTGLGDYQFNEHPCVVSNVNINLPPDVDYIKAGSAGQSSTNFLGPVNTQTAKSPNFISSTLSRLFGSGLSVGGRQEESYTSETIYRADNVGVTRVPTSIEIYFNLLPIQTRNQISNEYSLKDYSSGKLLKRGYW